MHEAGLLGERGFFLRKLKECEEGHSTILLVHTKIFTRLILILMHSLYLHKKYLEILLLLCNLHILASDLIKEESNKKRFCFFDQIFCNF